MKHALIKCKNEVRFNGHHFEPHIVRIIHTVRDQAPEFEDNTLWITSANDGKHMRESKHYLDEAFDFRTRNVLHLTATDPSLLTPAVVAAQKAEILLGWRDRIKATLGPLYDVVLEVDHMHVEYDPKELP